MSAETIRLLSEGVHEVVMFLAFLVPGGAPSTTLPLPGSPFRWTPALRGLMRLNPHLRTALLLYEAYEWLNQPGQDSPDGYTRTFGPNDCCSSFPAYCGEVKMRYRGVFGGNCTQTNWDIAGGDGSPCPAPLFVTQLRRNNGLSPQFGREQVTWQRTGSPACFDDAQIEDQVKLRSIPGIRPPPYDPTRLPDVLRPPTQPKPLPQPQPDPHTRPAPRPWPLPEVAPLPLPAPHPAPWPLPEGPWPEVDPRPVPEPVPAPQPEPAPGPQPVPAPEPAPAPRPVPDPLPHIDVTPPGRFHALAPPGRNVRERKVIASTRTRFEQWISGATEGMDFVDCLHKALPKDKQAKAKRYRGADGTWRVARVSFQRKLAAVYKGGGDHLDLPKALDCFVENHFEDKVIGSWNRQASRAFGRATGRSVGVGVGPWGSMRF